MAREQSQAILFELLRSFTSLARTLNTPKSVKELGVTRQTLRRHLNILEESKGEKLFETVDRRYRLTKAGHKALPEAEDLLARGNAWLAGHSGHLDGLFTAQYEAENGFFFYLQQHSLQNIWRKCPDIILQAMDAWTAARGDIESKHLKKIRPYFMVYRRHSDNWLCAEVGAESAFAKWFGWEWERSSVGRMVNEMPAGSIFASLMLQPFDEVYRMGGVRLDHIHTTISKTPGGSDFEPVSYQRVIFACQLADGSFALASLTAVTDDIEIAALS